MNSVSYPNNLFAALAGALLLLSPPAVVQAQEDSGQVVGVARLTPEVRASITKGLEWLAKEGNQNPDGSWGSSSNPVAETSLSLMAFMLKGYVPGRGGRYGRVMDNAITYLINKGRDQRGFLGTPNNHAGMYEHGLAVLALSEAWGQSKNPRLKTSLRRAVDIVLRAQNPEGGWRYNPEPRDADLSMTVMQLVALNSAREAGIAVPDTTIDQATKYVLSCQDESSGGFRYMPNSGEPGFARTAAGVMSLIMCGQRRHKATQRGLAFLKAYPERKFDKNYPRFHYSHYYAVQAMYQAGESDFQAWYPKISATILSKQEQDGSWRGAHGQAYGTSLSILILGVPYRYLPIYQR
ncbi:MAG: terpene cyclase/mutase family protein [Akkermansiaceae bacterium]|nr:terpene cyclase/mutase family protein [Akkermansiaceae bacterium]